MKNVLKVIFRIYDVIAHILGHIVLLGGIIGILIYSVYISYEKDELYIVLIELIIMLAIIVLVLCGIIKLKKGKNDK